MTKDKRNVKRLIVIFVIPNSICIKKEKQKVG